ncbi:unnamed protein product [Vitrella brassicaformis CCMP3155]|uniref:Glutamine amidotransferase-like class 1 domain-containing protein 1 n=1 Tax=Vitrella brassicaformis (strain CCMP3155) TaxID=1169540 RepID=A0A0G4GX04_VITBC|nr:unnamed protein product [Vitrella brassicaformis CCMP3155]|eukprot:CEM35444.1 unnamed protein product [Vitrella brassicaformis CCMP3155]
MPEIETEGGISGSALLGICHQLKEAGFACAISTVAGERPALVDVDLSDEKIHPDLRSLVDDPLAIIDIRASDYCALLIPHHLGAAQDLLNCDVLGDVLAAFLKQHKPICTIGYGTYGLCARQSHGDSSNGWQFAAGRLVTGVSVSDECRHPHFAKLPIVLQDFVEESGGTFVECPNDQVCVIVDRNLVTGPNEASTGVCIHNLLYLCQDDGQTAAPLLNGLG